MDIRDRLDLSPVDLFWKMAPKNLRFYYSVARFDSINYGVDGVSLSANLIFVSKRYTWLLVELLPKFKPANFQGGGYEPFDIK